MAILSLLLAVCALSGCVYLWLELQKKPSNESLRGTLKSYSEELSKDYARITREIEAEWTEMYQKFTRIAGRIDKTRALEAPPNHENHDEKPLSRSDLLRRLRRAA